MPSKVVVGASLVLKETPEFITYQDKDGKECRMPREWVEVVSDRFTKAPVSEPAIKETKVAKSKTAKKADKIKILNGGGTHLRQVGARKYDITGYRRIKTPGGFVSYDCGDAVAKSMAGKPLSEAYEIAAKKLDCSVRTLKDKYSKLNPGMQRMALGNRLRAL